MTMLAVVRLVAAWIWIAGSVIGVLVTARLAFFAHRERDKARYGRIHSAVTVLSFLYRVAVACAVALILLLAVGILSLLHAEGTSWRIAMLAVVAGLPWLLTWVCYRCFWLRFR